MAKHLVALKAHIQLKLMTPLETIIAVLILFSVFSFAVETLPNKSAGLQTLLGWADTFFLIVFSAEYLLRIWLAEKKTDYVFSFYGVVDLICVLPFYIATLMGLESLRLLRLFRQIGRASCRERV